MIRGFIAGNFDVVHPGYIKTFKECKENCDHFTILLHSDPTIERPNKLKPILSVDERIEQGDMSDEKVRETLNNRLRFLQ